MDRNEIRITTINSISKSLSARRAWIEICYLDNIEISEAVALRKESVDRNKIRITAIDSISVALRKESVDRNKAFPGFLVGCIVALRKESVDRNDTMQIVIVVVHASLSARRAWIEIILSR